MPCTSRAIGGERADYATGGLGRRSLTVWSFGHPVMAIAAKRFASFRVLRTFTPAHSVIR